MDRSFIQQDLELLKKHFDVKAVDFVLNKKDLRTSLKTAFLMLKGILWANVTFSWFADEHAYYTVMLSKLFRRRPIVVIGGYDVANIPEIDYGLLRNEKSASKVKYVLENADKVISVSDFTKREILQFVDVKNIELVHNGIDCNKFNPNGEKKDFVVTVGSSTSSTYKLKGIDTFVKASLAFPKLKFVIIGNYDTEIHNRLKQIGPDVEFTGTLSYDEVELWLKEARVYCQLSYRESFGMALAEAMCCECVPVVTDNTALPEVVGDTGFYAPYGDPEATAEAIRKALVSDKGKKARERICTMFSLDKREEELVSLISQ